MRIGICYLLFAVLAFCVCLSFSCEICPNSQLKSKPAAGHN